jgi:hypothetical protein
MNPKVAFLALLSITIIPISAQLEKDFQRKFDEAERRIVRLAPTAFPELPGTVVQELKRRGCTIPQEAFAKKPGNVIQGQFAKVGQTDWAVLCSVKGVSTILVFWNGSELNPPSLERRKIGIVFKASATIGSAIRGRLIRWDEHSSWATINPTVDPSRRLSTIKALMTRSLGKHL